MWNTDNETFCKYTCNYFLSQCKTALPKLLCNIYTVLKIIANFLGILSLKFP